MHICVYCSSSSAVDSVYTEAARALGARLAARGDTLVYGGATVGLMGVVARSVHAGGGRVIGVIPQQLVEKELAYREADELVITRDLRARKAEMDGRAEAFIALPGGFGTLEELLEVLTLRQLHFHERPIILLNTAGFYEPLIALFEHLYRERFAKPARELYHLAAKVDEVFAYLESYQPVPAPDKWLAPAEHL